MPRVIAVLAALAFVTLGLAPAASASPGPNDPDVSHSKNMAHLANLPKQPPFDNVNMLGTDIAFQGNFAIAGNYGGFVIYDIKQPKRPKIVSQVSCPGSQNDVSVSGNLLFLSTDSARSNDSCVNTPSNDTNPANWQGIKVFDISNKAAPQYVKSVATKCGSHTHTLVPDGQDVLLYVSSYFPSSTFPNCQPPHDQISIVKVPRANPAAAAVVAEPVLFPDGGNPGPGPVTETSGCHDITAFPSKGIAAGACMGDGILMDISEPLEPRVIERVTDDENFAFWHSATFNDDASKVIFTDELGGGAGATCNEEVGPEKGADAIFDLTGRGDNRSLDFQSYFKIGRHQTSTENCVAHNGSIIPVKGKDLMVQSWYQGGISVWDFTDSSNPHEIGFLERGPLAGNVIGGTWSAYYYNGFIYSSDIQKGLDVVDVRDRRTDPAKGVRQKLFNAQTQESLTRR